jgi:hypothetical protein
MPVEETPHYKWIKSLVLGNDDLHARDNYRDYLETYYPGEDASAGLEQVVSLVSLFKSKAGSNLINIVTHPPMYYQGADCIVIYDGVHRSAIATALGQESIQCRLVSNEYPRFRSFVSSMAKI